MERLEPPREYAQWLARAGGSNCFGHPNFILFWGQTRVERNGDGPFLTGRGTPAWFLASWAPPDEYAPIELWDNKLLGPFPTQGKYEILQPFYRRVAGKLEHMPLNYRSLEMMVPVAIKHKHDSYLKRKAAFEKVQERKDHEIQEAIADRLQDSVPAWEVGSFAGQGNTNSALRQKMDQIEQNYSHVQNFRQAHPVGGSL